MVPDLVNRVDESSLVFFWACPSDGWHSAVSFTVLITPHEDTHQRELPELHQSGKKCELNVFEVWSSILRGIDGLIVIIFYYSVVQVGLELIV